MDWKINYLEEDDIVLIKILNPINTLGKMQQNAVEAASLANYNQSQKYLIDQRGVNFELSLMEVEHLPDILKEAGINPQSKIALLMDPDSPNKHLFEFTKNILSLASIKFKLFTDEDEAVTWLKAEEPVTSSKNSQQ